MTSLTFIEFYDIVSEFPALIMGEGDVVNVLENNLKKLTITIFASDGWIEINEKNYIGALAHSGGIKLTCNYGCGETTEEIKLLQVADLSEFPQLQDDNY